MRPRFVDSSGNAFVVGYGSDWFVLKYSNANGALLWGPKTLSMAYANAAATDSAGNVIVTGGDARHDEYRQVRRHDGRRTRGPTSIPTAEGNVAIAANGDVVASGRFVQTFDDIDFVTIRYKSSDGSIVWGPIFTDGDGHGNDVVGLETLGFDGTGNVVLGGYSERPNGNSDIALLKYAGATGSTLWGPVYVGGPDTEKLAGFQVQGNSIAVGATSNAGMLTAVLDESLGIETALPSLPPAFCGQAYSFPFIAQNGAPGYTWSVVSGSLPSGLTLSASGVVSGSPSEQGTFSFTARVTDSVLAHADRQFSLVVTEDPEDFAILAFPSPFCQWALAVPGYHTSGSRRETTSVINVSIERRLTGSGGDRSAVLHLSVTIPGIALQDPDCLAPSIDSIAPTSGPSAGGTPVTILGTKFQPGAQLEIGGQPVSTTVVDPSQITSSTPALPPGTLANVLVGNPDTGNAILWGAFFFDFLDVPPSNVFHDSVEKLLRSGVTVGCGSGLFCVDASTTRAQMAVFLLKSLLGPTYVPPPPTGGLFDDVFLDTFAARGRDLAIARSRADASPIFITPRRESSEPRWLSSSRRRPAKTTCRRPRPTIFADSHDTFGGMDEDLNRGITADA
jgi:hypothetical protein